MGRTCAICNSVFLDEIDRYVSQRKFKTIMGLYKYMTDKYGDKFNIN